MSQAILYDSTLCIGCRECEKACAARWKLPYNDKIAAEERISAHKLTAIQTHGEHYSRRLCMHCNEPACASVCPVGALHKTALGPVVYDETKCIGCRYCMLACPFQVPTYEWSSRTPRVRKCDMCYDRQKGRTSRRLAPRPVPTGATMCGERDALIAEAKRRVADKPDEYYNRIYGIDEVGGTSVLFLSAVPFEQTRSEDRASEGAAAALTWRALSLVPDVVSPAAVLLGGIWWITHRREEVAEAERAEKEGKNDGRQARR